MNGRTSGTSLEASCIRRRKIPEVIPAWFQVATAPAMPRKGMLRFPEGMRPAAMLQFRAGTVYPEETAFPAATVSLREVFPAGMARYTGAIRRWMSPILTMRYLSATPVPWVCTIMRGFPTPPFMPLRDLRFTRSFRRPLFPCPDRRIRLRWKRR